MYKNDFPIFAKNDPLIYWDSAASTQKPTVVLNAMDAFYQNDYSNVHRGVCALAERSTELYESARQTVADFIGTKAQNIVWTKGATEAINLVANSFAQTLTPADEVLVSVAEHHANFVPWQQICAKTGARFVVFDVAPDGTFDRNDFLKKLSDRTKIVSIAHVSNVLGVENPVSEMIRLAHEKGAFVLIDGAQSIAHMPVNVTEMGCDFFVFSGHKIYGPTGIGALYGTTRALESLKPYQFGGDMIDTVSIEKTTFAKLPARLEAGTPPIAETIGLAAALNYVSAIGMDKIQHDEQKLTRVLVEKLTTLPRVDFIGNPNLKRGIVSFNINGIHPSDMAFMLGKQNVCVRVGHHCAMPIHTRFGVTASVRVSMGLYNDESDVDALIDALQKSIQLLG